MKDRGQNSVHFCYSQSYEKHEFNKVNQILPFFEEQQINPYTNFLIQLLTVDSYLIFYRMTITGI